MSPRP